MLVLKQMKSKKKQENLENKFSRLTKENQLYVLGIAEGLIFAQKSSGGMAVKKWPSLLQGKK